MDPKDNLNKQRKKPEHKDFSINATTKARLNDKNNYLAKLALFRRKPKVRYFKRSLSMVLRRIKRS